MTRKLAHTLGQTYKSCYEFQILLWSKSKLTACFVVFLYTVQYKQETRERGKILREKLCTVGGVGVQTLNVEGLLEAVRTYMHTILSCSLVSFLYGMV